MKNYLLVALIVGISIVCAGVLSKDIINLGSQTSNEHLERNYFYGGLVEGRQYVTITSGVVATMTASHVCDNTLIRFQPNGTNGAATATMPTAATIIAKCLPYDGSVKTVYWQSLGILASNTVVFASNTGLGIFWPEVTGDDGTLVGGQLAKLDFIRTATSTVNVILTEVERK